MKNDSILFFIHIPKSAGTSFRNILQQNFKYREIFTFYNRLQHKERLDKLKINLQKNKYKLLLGHIGFGIHNDIDMNVKYLTFLRDPVKRVISMYFHIKRDETHQFHKEVSKMTLIEYVKSKIDESSNNSQTRFLSGSKYYYQMRKMDDYVGLEPFSSEKEMLNEAKENLKNNIKFFGITERFDDSIILMNELVIIRNIYYHKFNIAKNKSKVTRNEYEIVREYNELDIELYNYANKLLDERLNSISEFRNKLNAFENENKYYGVYWGYKTRLFYKIAEKSGFFFK